MGEVDNPFDGEANRLLREQSVTLQQARDFVVLRYLKSGNTQALAHWLMEDYQPGRTVARMLSYMLQPERQLDRREGKIVTCSPEVVPFELKAKKRGGGRGRKSDSAAAERNQAIYELYKKLLADIGPGGSDSAIAELEGFLGPEITQSMIKEAIKDRSPKSRQGNK